MRIYDMANEEFDTKDDLVVSIGQAIQEVEELEKSRNDYRDEVARLEDVVVHLKEKNLELLSMIPTVVEKNNESEEIETLTISDIYE